MVGRGVLVKYSHPLVLPTARLKGDGLVQVAHGCIYLHFSIRRHAVHLEGQVSFDYIWVFSFQNVQYLNICPQTYHECMEVFKSLIWE